MTSGVHFQTLVSIIPCLCALSKVNRRTPTCRASPVSSSASYRMTAVVHTSITRAAATPTVAQNIAASSQRDLKAFATRAGQMLRPRLADAVACAQRRTNDRTIQSEARQHQHTPQLTVKPLAAKNARRERAAAAAVAAVSSKRGSSSTRGGRRREK